MPMRDDRTTRLLLAGGVIGPVLFVVVSLALGATRSGYSAWHTYVSMLSLGEGGGMMVANFIAGGALLIAFAVGLRRIGYGWAAILVGVVGAGTVTAGLFAADPGLGYPPGAPDGVPTAMSQQSAVHYSAGFVASFANVAAAILIARRFGRDPRSAGWARGVGLAAALIFVLYIATVVAGSDGPSLEAVAGVIQRVWILVGFGWLAVLALRSLRERPTQKAAV
jgi:uncharacterized protein DUF998